MYFFHLQVISHSNRCNHVYYVWKIIHGTVLNLHVCWERLYDILHKYWFNSRLKMSCNGSIYFVFILNHFFHGPNCAKKCINRPGGKCLKKVLLSYRTIILCNPQLKKGRSVIQPVTISNKEKENQLFILKKSMNFIRIYAWSSF